MKIVILWFKNFFSLVKSFLPLLSPSTRLIFSATQHTRVNQAISDFLHCNVCHYRAISELKILGNIRLYNTGNIRQYRTLNNRQYQTLHTRKYQNLCIIGNITINFRLQTLGNSRLFIPSNIRFCILGNIRLYTPGNTKLFIPSNIRIFANYVISDFI